MNQSNLTMYRKMFKSSTVLQLNYLHSLVTEEDGSKTQWYGENFLVSDLILNIFEKSGLNEHDLIQSHQEKIKKMLKSHTVLQLNYLHSLVTEGDGSKTRWYGENFLAASIDGVDA